MIRKLSSWIAAATTIGRRGPYLAPRMPPIGKAKTKAMPIERPWKRPRLVARFSGGEQSATYAWQIGVMHELHPSIRSAR